MFMKVFLIYLLTVYIRNAGHEYLSLVHKLSCSARFYIFLFLTAFLKTVPFFAVEFLMYLQIYLVYCILCSFAIYMQIMNFNLFAIIPLNFL